MLLNPSVRQVCVCVPSDSSIVLEDQRLFGYNNQIKIKKTRMPWLMRSIQLPTIYEISSQEHNNPAFVPDTPVADEPPAGGATQPNDKPQVEDVPKETLPLPVGENGRRKSSIAEIAFALNPSLNSSSRHSSLLSLTELVGPQYFRRTNYFQHPFGDSATVIEELLSLDKETDSRYMQSGTESPAKLVIWILFTLFMIAVAGAIILGAESYQSQTSNRNSSYPICNGTEPTTEPG